MLQKPATSFELFDPNLTLQVALVDDDATFGRFAAANLGINAPFDVIPMTSGDELLAYPGVDQLDCIILDFQLEKENGLQVAERLQQEIANPPPIIMLTGEGDERCVIKAFRSGFADYIPKRKLDFAHLQTRVGDAIQRVRRDMQREQEIFRTQRRHAEFSMFDEQTQCFSKNYVLTAAERLFALQSDAPFALLLVELETLDAISKTCGLAIAQKAREAFAKKLCENLRSTDIVGRYDDDRFLCALDTDCDSTTILELSTQISHRLACTINVSGMSVRISARIGGVFLPNPEIRFDNVIGALEQRLEAAQPGGLDFNPPTVAEVSNDNVTELNPLQSDGSRQVESRRDARRRVFGRRG